MNFRNKSQKCSNGCVSIIGDNAKSWHVCLPASSHGKGWKSLMPTRALVPWHWHQNWVLLYFCEMPVSHQQAALRDPFPSLKCLIRDCSTVSSREGSPLPAPRPHGAVQEQPTSWFMSFHSVCIIIFSQGSGPHSYWPWSTKSCFNFTSLQGHGSNDPFSKLIYESRGSSHGLHITIIGEVFVFVF